jgi:hypothetical protein
MAISETCGNCGSSIDIDRADEVTLWRSWQRHHSCKAKDETGFITTAQTTTEQSESKLGFTRSTQFDEE